MNPIRKCPCRGCGERFPGCHSECRKGYKEWSEYKKEEKRALREEDAAKAVLIASQTKASHYHQKHKKK